MYEETNYCLNCGSPVAGGSYFCPKCEQASISHVRRIETPLETSQPLEPVDHIRSKRIHNKSILSFVLALVGALLGFLLIPLVCSILAIAFGSTTKKWIERYKINDSSGHTLATIGLVLGICGLVFWGLLFFVALLYGLSLEGDEIGIESTEEQIYRNTATPHLALEGHWKEKDGTREFCISSLDIEVALKDETGEIVGVRETRYTVASENINDFTLILILDDDSWSCEFSDDRTKVTITQMTREGMEVFTLVHVGNETVFRL